MPFPHVVNHILSTRISMLCPTLSTINEHTLILSVAISADRILIPFPACQRENVSFLWQIWTFCQSVPLQTPAAPSFWPTNSWWSWSRPCLYFCYPLRGDSPQHLLAIQCPTLRPSPSCIVNIGGSPSLYLSIPVLLQTCLMKRPTTPSSITRDSLPC
jgi:hypothetical protein